MKNEKEFLQLLATYFKMVNSTIEDLTSRIRVAETALKSNPESLEAYDKALKDSPHRFSQGLGRQLSAIQSAIEKLPD